MSRFSIEEGLTGGGSDDEKLVQDTYHWSLVTRNKLELSAALFKQEEHQKTHFPLTAQHYEELPYGVLISMEWSYK